MSCRPRPASWWGKRPRVRRIRTTSCPIDRNRPISLTAPAPRPVTIFRRNRGRRAPRTAERLALAQEAERLDEGVNVAARDVEAARRRRHVPVGGFQGPLEELLLEHSGLALKGAVLVARLGIRRRLGAVRAFRVAEE